MAGGLWKLSEKKLSIYIYIISSVMYAFWLVLTYDLLDQNVVRTSVTHSAAPRVPLFCSYPILTSSVICYWTDARQFGIYLLNIYIYIYIYIYIDSAVNISQYVCNGREAIQSLNRLCEVNPRFLLFHFMQIVYFQFLTVNSNYWTSEINSGARRA